LTLDSLGNKTPQEIGTEVTPVWTFECMQLQSTEISHNFYTDGLLTYITFATHCNFLIVNDRKRKALGGWTELFSFGFLEQN